MTLILLVATLGMLTFLGVSCRRARLDLEEQVCECLDNPLAAAVGYGRPGLELVPAHPVLSGPRSTGPALTGLAGGRQSGPTGRRPHLRVVKTG